VEIDRQTIVSLLRERGEHEKAEQADQQLPDRVDHEHDGQQLEQFGLNPQEVISKIGL
jgi:hypothetical protein